MVDKDLFLHDLAVVAILKNEGHYLKEWLDYHLLAGVDHFYLYDNDSTDNQAEVAKPYVEAGLVDYFSAPGKSMQYVVYNDAVKRFKFQCRCMAFIDGDEFVYPKLTKVNGGGYSIIEVVDEVLSQNPNAAGLAINWQIFGSNGQDKADYSRGVLERFTRRAKKNWVPFPKSDTHNGGNAHVKTIANPRRIKSIHNCHAMGYFEGVHAINENGKMAARAFNNPVTAEKIVINHYASKTWEEFSRKLKMPLADSGKPKNPKKFYDYDRNDEFDDGILKYLDARAKVYQQPDNSHVEKRLLSALERNLSPTLLTDTPIEFYEGKIETFLTCRAVASYLQTRLADNAQAKLFEEAALKAILKSLQTRYTFADAELLLQELPAILKLPYPVIEDFRKL